MTKPMKKPQTTSGIRRITRLLNSKGVTLMEMILSIMALSIIIIAVTAMFAPIMRFYERANNLAEANALIDNISALVFDDVTNAVSVEPGSGTFTIRTSYNIEYYSDSNGILRRRAPGFDGPVLQRDFYKYKGTGGDETVFSASADCKFDENTGMVTITLTLTADDGWELTRAYCAKPIGLVTTNSRN